MLLRATTKIIDAALALAFPQCCAICGTSVEKQSDGVACGACWDKVRLLDQRTVCWQCGTPITGSAGAAYAEQVRCHRCDEAHFDCARACGIYEGALRAAVIALKRQPHIPSRLAVMLGVVLKTEPLNTATVIVPVPLHAERESQRGFNQAQVVAAEISRLTGLPLVNRRLMRTVNTQLHRAAMDARTRRDSVAGVFAVAANGCFTGERVLLIDDVFTSGATVSACANVLKAGGAEVVFALTIARRADSYSL